MAAILRLYHVTIYRQYGGPSYPVTREHYRMTARDQAEIRWIMAPLLVQTTGHALVERSFIVSHRRTPVALHRIEYDRHTQTVLPTPGAPMSYFLRRKLFESRLVCLDGDKRRVRMPRNWPNQKRGRFG